MEMATCMHLIVEIHVSSCLEPQDQQDLEAERQDMRHKALESEEIDLLSSGSNLDAVFASFLYFINRHFLQYSSVYSMGEWCAGPRFSFVFLGRLESLSFERRCVTLGCLVQFQYLQHWSALLHPGKLLGTKHEAHISQPMREPHSTLSDSKSCPTSRAAKL